MKFALIFLMAFVALSQQFYLQRPNVPMVWLSPHPARHFFNNYRPIVVFNEDLNRDSEDNQNNTDDGEQDEYPDVQSRIKSNRPSLFDNQQPQSGRFLASSFGNTNGNNINGYQNNNNNLFLRTFTTTTTSTTTTISLSTSTSTSIATSLTTSTSTVVIPNTATLSLTSVVRCVPAFQLSAVPVSCGRKKRGIDGSEDPEEHHHFAISPSETFKLMPTALPSETRELSLPAEQLTSSKDEVIHNVEVSTLDKQREKRFFLLNNRNYYTTSTVTATSTSIITIPTTTVSTSISTTISFATTTSTTFVFSNSTVTNTVNLINPAPTAQCAAVADPAVAPPVVQCVACLPAGFVVCAAAG